MPSPFKKHNRAKNFLSLELVEDRCLLSGLQSLLSAPFLFPRPPSAPASALNGTAAGHPPAAAHAGLAATTTATVSTPTVTVATKAGSEASLGLAPTATTGSGKPSGGVTLTTPDGVGGNNLTGLGISVDTQTGKSGAGGVALSDAINISVTGGLTLTGGEGPRLGLGTGGRPAGGRVGLGGKLDLGIGSGDNPVVRGKLTVALVDPGIVNLIGKVAVQVDDSPGLAFQLSGELGGRTEFSSSGQSSSGPRAGADFGLRAGDSSLDGSISANPGGVNVHLSLSDAGHSGGGGSGGRGGGPGSSGPGSSAGKDSGPVLGAVVETGESGKSNGTGMSFRPGDLAELVFGGSRNAGLSQQHRQGSAGAAEPNAPSSGEPGTPLDSGSASDNSLPVGSEPEENSFGGLGLVESNPETALPDSDLVALLLLQTNLLTGVGSENATEPPPTLGGTGTSTQAAAAGGVSEVDQDPLRFAPESEGRLADLLPADLTALEVDVQRFLKVIEQLAGGLSGLLGQMRLSTWLLVIAAAAAAAAITRRRVLGSKRVPVLGGRDGAVLAWYPGLSGAWAFDEP